MQKVWRRPTWLPEAQALLLHWRVQGCHRNLSACKVLHHYCEAFYIRSMGLESKMTKVEFIQEFVWEKSKVLKPYIAIYIAKYIAICCYMYCHIREYISVDKSKGLEPYIARWWSEVDSGDYSNEVLQSQLNVFTNTSVLVEAMKKLNQNIHTMLDAGPH